MEDLTIFWFRRDLRLYDNHGLFKALSENHQVLPVFIFDTTILSKLEEKYDRRVDFIHQAIIDLKEKLNLLGSDIKCYYGQPLIIFKSLLVEYKIHAIYANHDYEHYGIERDFNVKNLLTENKVTFQTFKDQCIFEKDEITKDDGKPYTVFTPYSRKWKLSLQTKHYSSFSNESFYNHFIKLPSEKLITLSDMGFLKTDIDLNKNVTVSNLLLSKYKEQRDIPSINGTSKLSVYLRFGVVSIRQLVAQSISISETWLNELIWREFYMMILWHFPYVAKNAFKKQYDQIPWLNNEKDFNKWCNGETGFPIVDAGMRELNNTGFMHNRVRMIVSSFLVKDLLIDWRWGEAYFAQKLNDFELSANNGGWQWAAGSGCDAAPYFRIFNPTGQQKKFDPNFIYIKKWVPEFGTSTYPPPIIDHKTARNRTLSVYKNSLNQSNALKLFNEQI
jgi:deoxyribodipyrimidine photo-lyase